MITRRLLHRLQFGAYLVLAVVAAAWYYQHAIRWRQYTPIVQSFLGAAVAGDTAALLHAILTPAAELRILGTPTAVLDSVRASMYLESGHAAGEGPDTVWLAYRTRVRLCGAAGPRHSDFQVTLIRPHQRWRIAYAGFEAC